MTTIKEIDERIKELEKQERDFKSKYKPMNIKMSFREKQIELLKEWRDDLIEKERNTDEIECFYWCGKCGSWFCYAKEHEKIEYVKLKEVKRLFGEVEGNEATSVSLAVGETSSAVNSPQNKALEDAKTLSAHKGPDPFEPKTGRLCDAERNEKSKVGAEITNKYAHALRAKDKLVANKTEDARIDSCETNASASFGDTHSQHKEVTANDFNIRHLRTS